MKPAVFLDRDGTVIDHVHYLRRIEDVALVTDGAQAIQALRDAGYLCVIVTNQSAVAKGLLTEDDLRAIHRHIDDLLSAAGTAVDGWYYCPEERVSTSQEAIDHPDRKPGPGMLLRAAEDLGIDLAASWMVGDSLSDVLAGKNAGCRGNIAVRSGLGHRVDPEHPGVDVMLDDLPDAVRHILANTTT